MSSGMPPACLRFLSSVHDSGRYKRKAIGKLADQVATDRLTATRQLSCLPTCRNTVLRRPRNGCPSSESRCHPQSSTQSHLAPAWLAKPRPALAAADPHHSRAHPPPNDAGSGACAERCPEPNAPPSAQRSSVHRAITAPHSSSSAEFHDQHVLRLWPGLPFMPQSASLVGLAWRLFFQKTILSHFVCLQHSSTRGSHPTVRRSASHLSHSPQEPFPANGLQDGLQWRVPRLATPGRTLESSIGTSYCPSTPAPPIHTLRVPNC